MIKLFVIMIVSQYWNDGPIQLTWDNFKGKPKYNGYTANTETFWTLHDSCMQNKCYFRVECGIIEDSSWALHRSDALLRHEQTHVMLSYAICNDFKKELRRFQGCSEAKRKMVISLFNKYWKSERRTQALFDKESKNGCIERIEKTWEENAIRYSVSQE